MKFIQSHNQPTKKQMKSRYQFLVAAFVGAISAQVCFAAFQAPLPEFKSKAEMKSVDQTGKRIGQNSNSHFYTGKPFEVEREGYLFKYRNYDPGMNRWTSVDPSGFPDGANNAIYLNNPLCILDPDGRAHVSVISYSPTGSGHNLLNALTVESTGTPSTSATGASSSVTLSVPDGSTGFVVQHVKIDYSWNYNNGSEYLHPLFDQNPSSYPTEFWEAWEVGNGDFSPYTPAYDTFGIGFATNTVGYYSVDAKIKFYNLGSVSDSSPVNWGTLGISGGLFATTTKPSWWNQIWSIGHTMTVSWE